MIMSFLVFIYKVKKFKARDYIIKRIKFFREISEFNLEAVIPYNNCFSFFGLSRYLILPFNMTDHRSLKYLKYSKKGIFCVFIF